LFARQLGWLHAVPDREKRSRMATLESIGGDLRLPDLHRGEYLAQMMMELGPTRSNGMGDGPTDWDVIAPFGEANGLDLGDMQTLAAMCRGYYRTREASTQPYALAPVDETGDPVADRRRAVAEGLRIRMQNVGG
jgi:hypothetical protein